MISQMLLFLLLHTTCSTFSSAAHVELSEVEMETMTTTNTNVQQSNRQALWALGSYVQNQQSLINSATAQLNKNNYELIYDLKTDYGAGNITGDVYNDLMTQVSDDFNFQSNEIQKANSNLFSIKVLMSDLNVKGNPSADDINTITLQIEQLQKLTSEISKRIEDTKSTIQDELRDAQNHSSNNEAIRIIRKVASQFAELLEQTDLLGEVLSRPGTIFAPSDSAFKLSGMFPMSDADKTARIISNHVVPGYGFNTSLFPNITTRLQTLASGYITVHTQRPTVLINTSYYYKGSVKSNGLVPFITENWALGPNLVLHTISNVIADPADGKPAVGSKCSVVDNQCPLFMCPPLKGCFPSQYKFINEDGLCCPEACVSRTQNGYGDICRATTMIPVVTETTLPPCPASCKDDFENCLKIYQKPSCETFAGTGYLCTASDGSKIKCSPLNFEQVKPQCENGMEYLCGCKQTTCEDPIPQSCPECVEGCYCPDDKPIWDDQSEQCIANGECAVDTCDTIIGENYLGTGNTKTECVSAKAGVTCETVCELEPYCTRYDDFQDMCSFSTQQECQQFGCLWKTDGKGDGPQFYCGSVGNSLTWLPVDAGSCSTKTEAACQLIQETQCLSAESTLNDNQVVTCKKLAASAQGQCNRIRDGTEIEIWSCFLNILFQTRSVFEEIPDIFSCCPVFGHYIQNASTVLALPCKHES
eukprot:m.54808 g.54808  ORF g.54808 m.54808 type:complete len:703 (-) comp10952_c0_seq1:32-2140(-)